MRMLTVLACAVLAACNATDSPSNPGRPSAATTDAADAPTVSPAAATALRRMSETLAGAQGIRFVAQAYYDEALPDGRRVQHEEAIRYTLSRPNGLRVEFHDAGEERILVYDGSMATLYEPGRRYYAITSAPPTVDEALDMLARDMDVIVPLSDFLFRDAGGVLLEKVTTARRVGTATLGGVETDHFAFRQAGLDCELWIARGERAVPVRITLTYRNVPGRPQFTATMSDWDLLAQTEATDFKITIPAEARQIDFVVDAEGA